MSHNTDAVHETPIIRFYDMMRAGHVTRWHTVNTAREQSVAEHAWLVTIIGMHLARHLPPKDECIFDDVGEEYRFMSALMTHDMPEVKTGDIPTPAKHMIQVMAGISDLFEKVDYLLMPAIPFSGGTLPPALGAILGLADQIEAAHWIRENGLGRHAEIVAQGCWDRVVNRVRECQSSLPQWDWYGATNKTLTGMGMPFLYKSALETPP